MTAPLLADDCPICSRRGLPHGLPHRLGIFLANNPDHAHLFYWLAEMHARKKRPFADAEIALYLEAMRDAGYSIAACQRMEARLRRS
jgi:hypothetical protein